MGAIKVFRLCFQRLDAVLRILHGFSRRTNLKNLLSMPDSIKATLGIGNVLFGGHSNKSVSNDCSEFRLLKFPKPKCQ